jgi:hypothetical protein
MTRQRRLIVNLLIPVGLSFGIAVFLLVTNRRIPFANAGNCDPWHYFGRFFLQDQIPTIMGQTRAGSRMPGTLPGFIFTHFLSGVRADYAYFLFFFVPAVGAVYFAAKRLFGTCPAIVAAVFFATQPLIVGDYSVTYTSSAVTYSAIALALAVFASTLGSGTKATIMVLATGFMWGTAVHTHLYSLSYNLVIPLYCIVWKAKPFAAYIREAVWKLALLLVGAVIATLFFGAINAGFLHGDFFFFMKQYQDAFTALVVEFQKPNWYLLGGRGAILLVGAAACVAQVLWIRRYAPDDDERSRFLTALIPFAALELAQIGYTIHGGITLQYDYYFVWLVAPLAILVASLLSRAPLKGRTLVAVLAAYIVLCLASDFGRSDQLWQAFTTFPPFMVLGVLLAVALVLIPTARMPAVLATLLLIGLLNATIRPEKIGLAAWEGPSEHDSYVRATEGMAFISSFHFATRPKFWIDTSGQNGWETIAYPRSYDYCVIDESIPRFDSPQSPDYNAVAETFSPNDYLVMTPKDEATYADAVEALMDQQHLSFSEMARKAISFGGFGYLIVIGRVH